MTIAIMDMTDIDSNAPSDVGLIGLAVMGQNLALNMADHGFRVSVYNRTTQKMHDFVQQNPDTPGGLEGFVELSHFVESLKRPRKILISVQAGKATDAVITQLMPLLEPGDILIDGGNAKWTDSIRRESILRAQGVHFVGCGISGGEEGARFGPSLMVGSSEKAWEQIRPIFTAMAAKVDSKTGKPINGAEPGKPVKGGVSCAAHIGSDGSGHYVKMVHNGIEYGDMQLICEAYALLSHVLDLSDPEIGTIFRRWNEGYLDSFLIETTAEVLGHIDIETGKPFVQIVMDKAGQKGTGKWTAIDSLNMGVPVSTIAESVFARCMSAIKQERVAASKKLKGPELNAFKGDQNAFIESVQKALYCSKICSYAQGFQLMRTAQEVYGWKLNFGEIAQIWRGGCIIRAAFLQKITEAYERNLRLANLLLDPYFQEAIQSCQTDWREVCKTAIDYGVPIPCFASAVAYYDSYRSAQLPQNLLQAQRDYFGAHSYERVDKNSGQWFHVDWLHPDRPELTL